MVFVLYFHVKNPFCQHKTRTSARWEKSVYKIKPYETFIYANLIVLYESVLQLCNHKKQFSVENKKEVCIFFDGSAWSVHLFFNNTFFSHYLQRRSIFIRRFFQFPSHNYRFYERINEKVVGNLCVPEFVWNGL